VGKENPTGYMLATFPQGYRLFEHIKSRDSPKDPSVLTKRGHSGGGHDRQDAYLYGYPDGRKKRFRSPAEFFLHLKYLCDADAKSREDCACKLCAPDELQPATRVKVQRRKKKTGLSDSVEVVIPVNSQTPGGVGGKGKQTVQAIAPTPLATVQAPALQPRPSINTSIQPEWIPAPAHPSHILDRLDPVTVAWLQQNSPADYNDYLAWERAHDAKRPEAERLHRRVIDQLDYMVWVGVKIPSYWPRRTSTVGPDGSVRSGRGTPVQTLVVAPQQQARVQVQRTQPLDMGQAQQHRMQLQNPTYIQPKMVMPLQQPRQQTLLPAQVPAQIQQQQQQQQLYPMPDFNTALGFPADNYQDLTQQAQFAYQQQHQQLQQQHTHQSQRIQIQHQPLPNYATAQPAYHHLPQQIHTTLSPLYPSIPSNFTGQHQQQQHFGNSSSYQQQPQQQQEVQQQGQGGFVYNPMSSLDMNILGDFDGQDNVDQNLEDAFLDFQGGGGGSGGS
jgi:hypothetical protein